MVIDVDKKQFLPALILSGVAQGSVLGSLLFMIFASGFADVISFAIKMSFADNQQLLIHAASENLTPAMRNINRHIEAIKL